jgi:lipopolysaccharide/colanic/teichoic acid biosynthesis glycosyltransferase
MAATALGAFLGGLVSTTLDAGWYENNSPPSEAVQAEVFALHRQLIGHPPPTSLPKRAFDLGLALVGLVFSTPVWLLIAFLVWFEDPGPIIFIKNSVGKAGRNFHQLKFRTMFSEAENGTGPVHAQRGDGRVLRAGRLLRKTALDELPQLLNILLGEMSFVGPRPQRTVLVHGYLAELPGYAVRHQTLPGLAGLAQVAGDYYITPLQKLRYDRIYAQHASLGFDLKLLALAFLLVFWLRWRRDWNGRLPRSWLRFGSRPG